ncbi:hypothetical protein DSM104443_03946 [Usitatibacter rugosus]|uniref:Calx-beta domain-containing protein n=2 Tax=Usitatibacter rugosus TaxID=2732067 RepID=A0A6M4H0I4_9PROT|nr:hypothetical protein DSM104443_03946 [Usitatibacter rugosus]
MKTIDLGPGPGGAAYVTILNDSLVEGPETFTVTLSAPSAGTQLTAGPFSTAIVTINSDDSGIAMAAATASVLESVGVVPITVVRCGPGTGVFAVNYATANGTAIAGTHYVPYAATLVWEDGDTAPKVVNIPIIDLPGANPSRTFSVALSTPAGGPLGSPSSTTVTILDDDNTLQFSAPTATVTEGATSVTLTVTRSGALANAAFVSWSTADGTAVAGTDFGVPGNSAPFTGMFNWDAGDASPKSFAIAIIDDALSEGTKTFTVNLLNAWGAGATIGATPTATVTLADNDAGFVFAVAEYLVNENGASVAVAVSRIGSAVSPANVTWTTHNVSAISGTDFGVAGNVAARTGVLSWGLNDAAPKVISIPILNNAIVQGSRTFFIALSAPSAGMTVGTPSMAFVTIADDEAPPAAVQFSATKYVVNEAAGTATLTVNRLGPDFAIPVSVGYTMTAGSAIATNDFTLSAGTLSWLPGDETPKAIVIPITNDAATESPEQFKVTLSSPSPGVAIVAPFVATVAVEDDDEVFPLDGLIPVGWVIPAGATTGWHVSNDSGAFEGVYQMRTDTVYDGESAGIEVTGTYQAGTASFRYKVSSELNFDYLRFFVDGVEQAKFSGTTVTGWTLFSVPVPAGLHTFRWLYAKDVNGSIGSDAAWIDAVTLPALQ